MFSVAHPLIEWLLDSQIPTIRYLTKTRLLEIPLSDPKVQSVFEKIQTTGPVPFILDKQIEKGQWSYKNHYYTPKYVSTHWSLLLLKELHVSPLNENFQDGIEYMLETTAEAIDFRKQMKEPDLTCLWSNIIRYAIHADRLGDPRLTEMINVCARSLQESDCACIHNADLPCAWGAVRTLWAFAAIPEEQRSLQVQSAIQTGIQFLVDKYDLMQANHPSPDNKPHSVWFKPSFPLFYQSDVLMTLRVFRDLGQLHHPGIKPALNWLKEKRNKNGKWRGANPYGSRTWEVLRDKEETSRWVTLFSLDILNQANMEI